LGNSRHASLLNTGQHNLQLADMRWNIVKTKKFTSEPQLHPSPEADDWQYISLNVSQEEDGGLDKSLLGLARSHAEPKGTDLPELPHDVLALIFWHACQPVLDARSEYGPRWERTFYPLWLGKISRSWRETAWASSELWEIIVLRINPEKIGIQTYLLREWFGRAKGRSLDIYIEEPPLPLRTHRTHRSSTPRHSSSCWIFESDIPTLRAVSTYRFEPPFLVIPIFC